MEGTDSTSSAKPAYLLEFLERTVEEFKNDSGSLRRRGRRPRERERRASRTWRTPGAGGMAALHRVAQDIGDGVDGLAAGNSTELIIEQVQQCALCILCLLRSDMVGHTLGCGGSEEQAAEEDEGEGAHLGCAV